MEDLPPTPIHLCSSDRGDIYADAEAEWAKEAKRGRKGGASVVYGPARLVAGRIWWAGQIMCAVSGLFVTLI